MSTYSSELISISSISAYDIYKTYINPRATGKQLMWVNYVSMTAFALFMGGFSTMLYYIGVGMGYLYLLMGVIISSGVAPAAATLIWKDQASYRLHFVLRGCNANSFQSWAAATFSPILGFCCSMASWLGTTYATAGEFSIESTGANTPMLVGNVVALCSPLIFIPLLTYIPPFKPQKYDWVSMATISKGEDTDSVASSAILDPEQMAANGAALQPTVSQAEERIQLDRSAKTARILCATLALCFIILWPMPLFGTGYIFDKSFFTGWIVVGIIWLFFSTGIVVFLPLWQSRKTISHTVKSVFADMTGKGGRRGKPEVMQGETADGDVTPPQMAEKSDTKE